ncbi:suppressor of fused domain protein [Prescottella defluvii]|uniref:suppressor of fused domain protein n=1 Tax=Prescottella defluvii TaxID=1323361 RepID=UPI0004F38411|nr:suppressor of fused domain protein [Prescottella defluvii]
MTEESERLSALERHVRRFWDGHILESAPWDRGPILERVPHFTVYRVCPQRVGKEGWVYVTVGSSVHGSTVGGTEFFVMSPDPAEIHSETLAMVSHFHSFEAHRLDVGSVMNIGRPWIPGSRMDHLLVSLPYFHGPELEWAPTEAGGARFLWLLPIHKSEADFVKRETLDEFESILEAEAVDVLDTNRDPVVCEC